jgi:hypothetical protein
MDTQIDDMGPVDVVVIGFPAGSPMTGEAVPMVLDLVDRGIIRVLDALVVYKEADGTFSGFEATGLEANGLGALREFEGASTGLLGDEDARVAADELEPGTAAVLLVYENRWAAPFVAAVRRNGGVLIDNQRIPMAALVDALDAVEAPA